MKKKKNIIAKKGGMLDLFIVMIVTFILIVCLVAFTYVNHTVHQKLLENAPTLQKFAGTENVTEIINDTVGKVTDAYENFKWISVFLIAAYFMSILVSAFLVRTHPVWFVPYIFVVLISTIVAAYLANVYETIYQTPILADTWFNFVGANYIFLNYPIIICVIGFLAGILMYITLDWGKPYG